MTLETIKLLSLIASVALNVVVAFCCWRLIVHMKRLMK